MMKGKYGDGGMAKKGMKQVAKKEVMTHEAKMHGKKMADGGIACGHRSSQDYGKRK